MMREAMEGTKMSSEKSEKIDDAANDLDELKTTVDVLEDDPPDAADPNTIDTLKQALERASEAIDDLEEQND